MAYRPTSPARGLRQSANRRLNNTPRIAPKRAPSSYRPVEVAPSPAQIMPVRPQRVRPPRKRLPLGRKARLF